MVAASLIDTFIVERDVIPSGSMEGTILIGDYLLVSKINYGAPHLLRQLLFLLHTIRCQGSISDVDLIFVGGSEDELGAATKLASATMRVASVCFEVDAALRPEGKAGALVRTLARHLAYSARAPRPGNSRRYSRPA